MQTSLNIFICIVNLSNSLQTGVGHLNHSQCLRKYTQQVFHINHHYMASLEACNDKENINRRPPKDLNPEVELAKHKETSAETCLNISACNLNTDINEFFHCHSKTAATNMQKYTLMHLNASSVIIELNDQYAEEEKEILRCQLAAKRKNILDLFEAHNEHLKCLNLSNGKYNESYSRNVFHKSTTK